MSRIQNKIVIPYLALSLLVAVLGAVVGLMMVAETLRTNLELRLQDNISRGMQSLGEVHGAHTEKLRLIALGDSGPQQALSTSEAFAPDRRGELHDLLRSNLLFHSLSQLEAFDAKGTIIADERDLARAPDETVLRPLGGSSLYDAVDGVQYILEHQGEILAGTVKDSYSSLETLPVSGGKRMTFLYTAVPVRLGGTAWGSDSLVGGLIAAEPLDRIFGDMRRRNNTFYTVLYDTQGRILASNALGQEDMLELPPETLQELRDGQNKASILKNMRVNREDFLFLYAPVHIDGQEQIDGYLAVASEGNSIFGTWMPTRSAVNALSIAALLAVIGLGYAISRRITMPLQELVTMATAISQGKRDQRSRIYSSDEVGTLAAVLDEMTDRLIDLYRASREMGVELEINGILHVAVSTIRRLVPRARIAAILPIEGRWVARFTGDSEEIELAPFDYQIMTRIQPLVEAATLPEISGQEAFRQIEPRWVLPLQTQQRLIGLLMIGTVPPEIEPESLHEPLVAVAGMTAAAFQNALLYMEVEQEASKNRAILQSIADGVIVCDPSGRVMLANLTAIQMVGRNAEDLTGQHFSELALMPVHPSTEVFASGSQQQLYEINRRTLSLSVSQVISSDNRFLGTVVVLHDVTAQREIDRAKTDFIGTISHELRTPLMSIHGYIELLLRPSIAGELNSDQQSFVQTIRNHVQNMSSLLNNVILIASIEAGALAPRPAPIQLSSVVDAALQPLRPQIDNKGLRVVIALPPTLPLVMADYEQLRIALSNLIDNAARYTAKGAITIKAFLKNQYIQVDVVDTGPGISQQDLSRLFIRFNRGGEQSGNAARERGAGLGLAIARQLIEQQGGTIAVSSEPGIGSVFSLRVPIADAKQLPAPQQSEPVLGARG